MKNVLFVCKYNRFRSKVAEALFNKYNKNKEMKAKSAGIIKGSLVNPIQKKISRKFEIDIKNPTMGISTKLLKWQDTIILVCDDIPPSVFKDNKKFGKKLIIWRISDAKTDNEKEIMKIISNIDKKVKKLVKLK